MNEVRVSRKGADRVTSGHPWIFTSDIADRDGAQPGRPVKVADPRGRPLGTAHYSSSSQISLRMLSRQVEEIGRDFFLRRLRAAEAHRRTVVRNTDAYRVVHGEADLLPALVVDRYGDYLVVQTLDQGMDAAKERDRVLPGRDLPSQGHRGAQRCCRAHEGGVAARDHHARRRGSRVGDRADERAHPAGRPHARAEDRHLSGSARQLSRRRPLRPRRQGARLLHLHRRLRPAPGGQVRAAWKPPTVRGPALVTARANAAANGIANIDFKEADIFQLLTNYASARRHFSMVVLDPPAFAKSRRNLESATTGYKEINLRALRLLQPGGILVTCSCSHHLGEAALLELVAQASLDANRTLRVLERRTQSQDHPILLTVPETLYLKCLILEVV